MRDYLLMLGFKLGDMLMWQRFFHSKLGLTLASLVLGLIATLGFAPYGFWVITLITLGFEFFLVATLNTKKQVFWSLWLYFTALNAATLSWLNFVMHGFGQLPLPVSWLLEIILSAYLAIFHGLLGCVAFKLAHRLIKPKTSKTAAKTSAPTNVKTSVNNAAQASTKVSVNSTDTTLAKSESESKANLSVTNSSVVNSSIANSSATKSSVDKSSETNSSVTVEQNAKVTQSSDAAVATASAQTSDASKASKDSKDSDTFNASVTSDIADKALSSAAQENIDKANAKQDNAAQANVDKDNADKANADNKSNEAEEYDDEDEYYEDEYDFEEENSEPQEYVHFYRNAFLLCFLPLALILADYLVGIVFTGFPWMYLGYTVLEGPFASYAPLLGVRGITLVLLICAGSLALTLERRYVYLPVAGVLFAIGIFCQGLNFTQDLPAIKVTGVQGNIAQQIKWDPRQVMPTIGRYIDQSMPYFGKTDLIVWPESALPVFAQEVEPILADLNTVANTTKTPLLTGIQNLHSKEDGTVGSYNSIFLLGSSDSLEQVQVYNKRHLVPFGERVPFESVTRQLGSIFNFPMSGFSSGETYQKQLQIRLTQTHATPEAANNATNALGKTATLNAAKNTANDTNAVSAVDSTVDSTKTLATNSSETSTKDSLDASATTVNANASVNNVANTLAANGASNEYKEVATNAANAKGDNSNATNLAKAKAQTAGSNQALNSAQGTESASSTHDIAALNTEEMLENADPSMLIDVSSNTSNQIQTDDLDEPYVVEQELAESSYNEDELLAGYDKAGNDQVTSAKSELSSVENAKNQGGVGESANVSAIANAGSESNAATTAQANSVENLDPTTTTAYTLDHYNDPSDVQEEELLAGFDKAGNAQVASAKSDATKVASANNVDAAQSSTQVSNEENKLNAASNTDANAASNLASNANSNASANTTLNATLNNSTPDEDILFIDEELNVGLTENGADPLDAELAEGESAWFNSKIPSLPQDVAVPLDQPLELNFIPAICYESIFPELMTSLHDASTNGIIMISNDTWFGTTRGPDEHLAIARMRSMEMQKPMIRITNSGHTVLIDKTGKVTAQLPQDKLAILHADFTPNQGMTPYVRWNNIPFYIILLVLCGLGFYLRKQDLDPIQQNLEALVRP